MCIRQSQRPTAHRNTLRSWRMSVGENAETDITMKRALSHQLQVCNCNEIRCTLGRCCYDEQVA